MASMTVKKVHQGTARFYGVDEYEAPVEASRRVSPVAQLVVVLIGGEPGLHTPARCGRCNGPTWTSHAGNCVWRGASGTATSPRPKEDGSGTCR